MKIKIFPILLAVFFIIVFFIFYKGLQNSSIYTPNVNIEKNIPSFEAKMFITNKKVRSEDIFNSNQFYLLNIWSSWCVPCRDEHPRLMILITLENIWQKNPGYFSWILNSDFPIFTKNIIRDFIKERKLINKFKK